ncbi:sensor protein ZraS [bacterium BMS3Abin04]|nr:sensor protein ZraS [bacterium BMS3Abin04]
MINSKYPKIITLISFLMILLLGFFTYLNYNRERELMFNNLTQEGLAISNIMETFVRQNKNVNFEQIQTLFKSSVWDTLIEQIILVDDSLTVKANSAGGKLGWKLININISGIKKLRTDIIKFNNVSIFRLIKPFYLDNKQIVNLKDSSTVSPGGKTKIAAIPYYILISFNADEYVSARKEDLLRAFGSGTLLLLLLISSIYFIIVIQKYNLLNRSLIKMKNYAFNIVESMPNGLISIDKTGAVKTINKNAIKLLGLAGKRVKNKLITELIPSCEMLKQLVTTNEIKNEQIICNLADGSSIPLSVNTRRLLNEEAKMIGNVIIFSDLREIKILEKEIERTERLASMGRMAAGIAHEIRNPLSSIKGLAQYLRNKFDKKSESREYATVMINEVDRLNRVIQDMLNFAKPHEPKLLPINIKEIISHSLRLIETELNTKKVNVILKDDNSLNIALADSDLLTQVFLNLFANAIDAIVVGGLLQISLSEKDNFVVFEISDDGKGIKNENISKIFDPFFTSKQNGTGLGLAIVYRIIEYHNGEISVNSKQDNGTTFIIKLPKSN